mmetsp:Transcript_36364/g.78711  ORF Transcript_36364/g.78711 Transcript_36364/m.78711 type:complete len:92 (+) Transcript_36364:1136-1411(+)
MASLGSWSPSSAPRTSIAEAKMKLAVRECSCRVQSVTGWWDASLSVCGQRDKGNCGAQSCRTPHAGQFLIRFMFDEYFFRFSTLFLSFALL